jgi:site-specific recombinase XerD
MLGHMKVATTQIYAEVTERTIEKDVRRLTGKPQRRKRR